LAADPTRSPADVEDQGDRRRLEAVRAMYFGILAKALDVPGEWTYERFFTTPQMVSFLS